MFNLNNKGSRLTRNLLKYDDINKGILNRKALKRFDKHFNKGLIWYIIDGKPLDTENGSIFFRKQKNYQNLSFDDKKVIVEFEDKKMLIDDLAFNINFNLKRTLRLYSIDESPKEIAKEYIDIFNKIKNNLIEEKVIPKKKNDFACARDYIIELGFILERFDIFAFEYNEHPRKNNKFKFDGFFLEPNLIVTKKNPYNRKRQVFTLLHEFAHYLLNDEEIDIETDLVPRTNNIIEQWCNEFAFYFLLGEQEPAFLKLNYLSESEICENMTQKIARNSHLSQLAIYNALLYGNKIDLTSYHKKLNEAKKRLEKIKEGNSLILSKRK